MQTISFYPGPSKVYPETVAFFADAHKHQVLSSNHRSPEFVEISRSAIQALKEKLGIPQEYWVFYTSSATECWEIIAQSLIDQGSKHIYNGAFGGKWSDYTARINAGKRITQAYPFPIQEVMSAQKIKAQSSLATDTFCLTHNETSNGSTLPAECLPELRRLFPQSLIAVDATSSMAGVSLPYQSVDVLFASVQKCFGLPAGMALMVCSPRAIAKAQALNRQHHYNSLAFMIDKMQDWQTTYTPNVLNIYLLMRVMEMVPPIQEVEARLLRRLARYEQSIEPLKNFGLTLLIADKRHRSKTVIAVKGESKIIQQVKAAARQKGIILGNGYGKWKEQTFRIANFPAINDQEVDRLIQFLEEDLPKIL